MKCPYCDGRGASGGFVDYANGTGGFDRNLPCSRCNGTGVLTPDQQRAIEEGDRLRRIRLDRGLTLRRAAEACQVSVVAFSDMERGRVLVSPDTIKRIREVGRG